MLSLILVSTSSCVIETPPLVVNSKCFTDKPISLSRKDALTRGTKEQILLYNEAWMRDCANQEGDERDDRAPAQ